MSGLGRICLSMALFALASPWTEALAQSAPPAATGTLFQNVRVFDGKGGPLSAPSNVLVKGNVIEHISITAIKPEDGITIIAGGGRTLIPGLIDNHWHAAMARVTRHRRSVTSRTTVCRLVPRRQIP